LTAAGPLRRERRRGGQRRTSARLGVDPRRLITRTLDDLVSLPGDVIEVG
jgi:hypothetical protein